MAMKLAIGSDHAGFVLKEALKQALQQAGHEILDLGCSSPDSCDYPDYGYLAARAVTRGECERGIVICATGVGMSITANKVKGIRAALCHDLFTVEMSRKHNDANMLVLGARCVTEPLAREMATLWLQTEFEGGRHQRRVDKIMAGETC
jgi:ribose 5-phosphate isomerase B